MKASLYILVAIFVGLTVTAEKEQEVDFVPLFDGESMDGWVGNTSGYEAKDGVLACLPGKGNGGKIFTEKEYGNFILRFEFKLTQGANNGLALRCPLEGRPHGKGFESQIMDNTATRYQNLKETQYHGSLYKLLPAKRGFLAPVGEWNRQEVMMDGNHVRITLNGEVILEDADISRFKRPARPPWFSWPRFSGGISEYSSQGTLKI